MQKKRKIFFQDKKLQEKLRGMLHPEAYDRLKKRKQYGTLDNAQWNTPVAEIQNIRDGARNGKISDTTAVEKLNGY